METSEIPAISLALARFEAALTSIQHPLLNMLQPGLTANHINERMQPTGLVLPPDAAALWQWRNGLAPEASTDPSRPAGSEFFPGGLMFLDLDKTVERQLSNMADFPWDQLDDSSPTWFNLMFTGHADTVFVECAGPETGSLIYLKGDDYNTPEDISANRLPSVAAAIQDWAKMLEKREWTWTQERWQLDRPWAPGAVTWH